jgi:hypothetical protein
MSGTGDFVTPKACIWQDLPSAPLEMRVRPSPIVQKLRRPMPNSP